MASKLSAHLTPSHLLPKIRVEQEKVLEANFQRNKNPNDLDVTLIAAEAGMLEPDVQVCSDALSPSLSVKYTCIHVRVRSHTHRG